MNFGSVLLQHSFWNMSERHMDDLDTEFLRRVTENETHDMVRIKGPYLDCIPDRTTAENRI